MAKEIMLDDGRTALFDDDATEADIDSKLKSQNLKRRSGPVEPKDYPSVPLLGPQIPAAASFVNSLAFGLPEMAARAMGGGPYIEAVRQQYPVATTAGDVAGLANPFRLGMKVAGKGASALGERMMSRPGSEMGKDAVQSTIMNQGPTLPQQAGKYLVKPAVQTAGGVVGAQMGASALGAARSPDQPMAGAQQGAQVFRQVATNLPGTQLVPGAQTGLNAVTSAVPAALGYGAAMTDYLTIDEIMRQEAARRALQGSQ